MDYPVPGVDFWDITTVFKDAEAFATILDWIVDQYKNLGITKVVGLESRGFVFGAALAARLGAGFVPIRKPGKLPSEVYSITYEKEYGIDSIEIHTDALDEDDVVLVHDDVLATGGTAAAAFDLVSLFHPKTVYGNFVVSLDALGGRARINSDVPVTVVYSE